MRRIAAVLGLAYALLNFYAGVLLTSSGIRLASKAFYERFLLLFGGALILLFAVLLAYQVARLMGSKS